jgi:hypothetical protein
MNLEDAHVAIMALAMYAHNTAPVDIVSSLFPNCGKTYLDEKCDILQQHGIMFYLGWLDKSAQRTLVKLALDKYQAQAEQRVQA